MTRRQRRLPSYLIEVAVTLVVVTFLSFLLMRLAPIDPATAYARRLNPNASPTYIESVREEMGLDKPLLVQYGLWVGRAFQLDFGESLVTGDSALYKVLAVLPTTLAVVSLSAVFQAIGTVFVGSVRYFLRDSIGERIVDALCIVVISIPIFYLASSWIDVFAVKMGVMAVAGNAGVLKYFPAALCMSVYGSAFYGKLLSKDISHQMQEDYAFYARCRGLKEGYILLHHALPKAVMGLIPSFLQSIGLSFTAAAIVERIFSLPGIGNIVIEGVLNRDSPVVHVSILFMALALVICNILSDLIRTALVTTGKRKVALNET
ncbi:ABC transporter permease [Fusibacter sp. JL298sf-3]